MAKLSLSKSSLVRGIQCQKSLYFYKNNYNERDPISAEQKERFDRGHRIGVWAQKLFPNGIDLTPPNVFSYDQSIKATQVHITRKTPVLYEAAFRAFHTMIALDILVYSDGSYCAYEVKSNKIIKDVFIQDAAIQYAIITASGIALKDICLITLHPDYRDNESNTLEETFVTTSILDKVKALQPKILQQIEKSIYTLSQLSPPEINMGIHCEYPYNCDFIGKCSRESI